VWTNFNVDSPFEYPLSSVFYCGLLQGCAENNITPVLVSDDLEIMIKRYQNSAEFDCKGVIVLDVDKFEKAIDFAKQIPNQKFFFVNYVMKQLNDLPPNMVAIVNDNYHGAYRMAEHLISCNCKDFMLMSVKLPKGDRSYHNRLKGALDALRDNSLGVNKKDICIIDDEDQTKVAYQTTRKILQSGRHPQAIFCVNDLIASGVSQALEALNITDITVSGFDNLFPHLHVQWGFSTMKVNYSQMVLEALRRLKLDEKIEEKVIKIQSEIIKK
jgi:DNA-binding LacI/PurR family transcriptional regulator